MNRAHPMVVLTVALVTALVLVAVLPAGSVRAANDTISSLSVAGSPFATDLAPLPAQVRFDLVLSRKARVTIAVFDASGTRVRRLARGVRRPAGQHSWQWDGTRAGMELPDGIYTVQVRAKNGLGIAVARLELRKGLPPIYPANPGAIVIAVDPGHGGRFPGAIYGGYMEKDLNLDISLQLRDLLEHAGVQVVMSRTTDVAVSEPPADHNGDGEINRYDDDLMRNDSANLARADAVVHVHNNAATSSTAHGTATYTSRDQSWTPQAVDLARYMVDEEFSALDAYRTPAFVPVNRGVRYGWYYYVGPYDPPFLARPALMPSVLSESLYMSNPAELEALKRPDVRLSLAAAIYSSLARWLETRDHGVGYELVSGPAGTVPAGSVQTYRVRLTNRGNRASAGWELQLRRVAAVPIYDGSPEPGALIGAVAVPDGLQPGRSVELEVAATAPAEAGDWLVKADIRLADDTSFARAGIVSLQVPLTTTSAP